MGCVRKLRAGRLGGMSNEEHRWAAEWNRRQAESARRRAESADASAEEAERLARDLPARSDEAAKWSLLAHRESLRAAMLRRYADDHDAAIARHESAITAREERV